MAQRFERAGRRLDDEIDRVIRLLEKEVRPAAQKHSARLLRTAARTLERLAQNLQGRGRRPRSGSRRRKKARQ